LGFVTQRDRLTNQTDVTILGVRHILRDAEMLDLFVLEHLIDRIDRATRNASGVELPDPGIGRFLLSERVDLRIERIAVLGTCRRGGIFGVGHELERARACAQRPQIRPPVVAILM
jgi:hypothetical protein